MLACLMNVLATAIDLELTMYLFRPSLVPNTTYSMTLLRRQRGVDSNVRPGMGRSVVGTADGILVAVSVYYWRVGHVRERVCMRVGTSQPIAQVSCSTSQAAECGTENTLGHLFRRGGS